MDNKKLLLSINEFDEFINTFFYRKIIDYTIEYPKKYPCVIAHTVDYGGIDYIDIYGFVYIEDFKL